SIELGFAHFFDGELVGHTSYLNVHDDDRVVEIGNTWLAPSAWGTGANTDAKNARARAALAGLGAEFEGVFRKHMVVRGGERRDSAWYAVIDDDWPLVKIGLEQNLSG